jgi:tyrosinase
MSNAPLLSYDGDSGFRKELEDGFHNPVHNWIAGSTDAAGKDGDHMQYNLSHADPIFFLHHAYIDKLWAK